MSDHAPNGTVVKAIVPLASLAELHYAMYGDRTVCAFCGAAMT